MDYIEPEVVAERLGLDRNTVYKFLQDGTIPAVQLGRKWLVSERRLVAWLEEETQRQTLARQEASRSAERTVRRMDSFAADARESVRQAHSIARGYNHRYIGQEHLLLALAESTDTAAVQLLRAAGLSAEEARKAVESRVAAAPSDGSPPPKRLARTDRAKRAMRLAERHARVRRHLVTALDLLWGIAECGEGVGYEILQKHGITAEALVIAQDKPNEKDVLDD